MLSPGGRPPGGITAAAPVFGRMGGMTEILTPRLLLRRWTDDDLVPMAEINADPQVMRWIGDGLVRDLDAHGGGHRALGGGVGRGGLRPLRRRTARLG